MEMDSIAPTMMSVHLKQMIVQSIMDFGKIIKLMRELCDFFVSLSFFRLEISTIQKSKSFRPHRSVKNRLCSLSQGLTLSLLVTFL